MAPDPTSTLPKSITVGATEFRVGDRVEFPHPRTKRLTRGVLTYLHGPAVPIEHSVAQVRPDGYDDLTRELVSLIRCRHVE